MFACGITHMLLVIGVLITVIAAVIVARTRLPGRLDGAKLGWMSQQWIAEYRSSHSS